MDVNIVSRLPAPWKNTMEFLAEYGMFLAKVTTLLVTAIILLATVFFFLSRGRQGVEGHLEVRNLNRKYEQMRLMLKSAILSKKSFKRAAKEAKRRLKRNSVGSGGEKPRVFVLNFKGDIRATEVSSLREEVTALLTVAGDKDEVLVKIESSGGTVHGYGLAASQLKRIRDGNIRLIAAVDKVAASGGYMMACVADRIIAAPFAILGSIGVVAQLPNFNRLLKKHDIDYEQITAGKYKRTLTMFGENTEEQRQKFREELEEAHRLFMQFVKENRAVVDIESTATGEYWYGTRALDLKLVDELLTSDDYLSRAADGSEIYELEYKRKKPVSEKIFGPAAKLFLSE